MGEMFKTARALQKEYEEKKSLTEATLQREIEDTNEEILKKESLKESAKVRRNKFNVYKENVRKALLTEGLKKIYLGSMQKPTAEETAVCEALLGNYIDEHGADNLLEGFHDKTPFLESLYTLINKHYRAITEDTDMDDDVDKAALTPANVNDFLDELDKTEDMEDITNTIRLRVANAEEEFVNKVEQDNANLQSILKDTASRVQSEKPNLDNNYGDDATDDVPDEGPDLPDDGVQQEAVRIAKRKIQEVQEHTNNIFGQMVRNITKASVVNTSLREQFGSDNGRVDMDRVVESARCMYTMLEMVSTLMIENVDEQYLKDTLDSIN